MSSDDRLRRLMPPPGKRRSPAEDRSCTKTASRCRLNYHDNVLYTTTAQGCGGNPNQFVLVRPGDEEVGSFDPGSGGLWPRLGPSIGKDGRVYAGSGDGDYFPERQVFGQAIVPAKLNPATKAMEIPDWFAQANAYWLRKRDLDMNVTHPVASGPRAASTTPQSSEGCSIWLLDTSALGGEDHRTPVRQTPLVCNEEVHFRALVRGARWRPGKTPTARGGCGSSGGRSTPKFTAPIEHGEVA